MLFAADPLVTVKSDLARQSPDLPTSDFDQYHLVVHLVAVVVVNLLARSG